MCDNNNIIHEQIKDHESRIRILESAHIETKYGLLSLENSNNEIKLLIQEVNNNQTKLLNKFVDCAIKESSTDNSIKQNNNKNMWSLIFKIGVILAPFASAGLTWFFKK